MPSCVLAPRRGAAAVDQGLRVRLNADELEALLTMAAARGVPASTLARDLLMKEVRSESADPIAVIARIRADLEALASTVA